MIKSFPYIILFLKTNIDDANGDESENSAVIPYSGMSVFFFHISLINNEYYSFTRAIKQPAIRISVNLYRVFIRCLAGVRFNIGVDFLIRLPFGFLPPERWVVLGMFIPVQY